MTISSHHIRTGTLLQCFLVLFLSPSRPLEAFGIAPAFDAAREQVLVGSGTQAETNASKGQWTIENSGLTDGSKQSAGDFWLAGGDGSVVPDGTVRFRFVGHPPLAASLVVRARPNSESTGLEEAYGLAINGSWARLFKIQGGTLEKLEFQIWMSGMKTRSAIEVIVSFFGPHLVAVVYDVSSHGQIGILSTTNVPAGSGGIGLLASGKEKSGTKLELLSTRQACQNMPAAHGTGGHVVVWEPAVAEGCATEWAERLEADEATGRIAFRTDPAGLEGLFCAGCPGETIQTDLPWKYVDVSYLRRQDAFREQAATPTAADSKGVESDVCRESVLDYNNPEMVADLLHCWHRKYPARTRLEQLGISHQGRPILALGIGLEPAQWSNRPTILLNGAHHGDELLSTTYVLDAARILLEAPENNAREARWLHSLVVWCVPIVNPDGLTAFLELSVRAGRKNGRDLNSDGIRSLEEGVDLNRNYPFYWGKLAKEANPASRYYHGPGPASEPETQAMMRLAEREHFAASISFHQGSVVVLAPYTTGGAKQPEPDVAWQVANEAIKGSGQSSAHGHMVESRATPGASSRVPERKAPERGRPRGRFYHARTLDRSPIKGLKTNPFIGVFRVVRKLYAVDGVDQDWLRYSFGTVALLVEGGIWPPPLDTKVKEMALEAIRPLWKNLFDRLLDGPSISGRVVDKQGNPVDAVVSLLEETCHEGERWTTRPFDGHFDRFLPAPGRYHVRVQAKGYQEKVQEVVVGRERARVEIQVEPIGGDTEKAIKE